MAQIRRANVLTPDDSLYPVGSEAEVILVTPEMASDWSTARRWEHQRTISPATVGKYLRDMMQGLWKLSRQGLVFNTDGYNIDGAHRLRALANADATTLEKHYGVPGLYFWIYPDEPTDTFDVYDQNYRRQASHLIHKQYARHSAAAARLLAAASDQDPWTFPRLGRVTTPEVLQTERDWPEIERYMPKIVTVAKPTHIPTPEHGVVLAQAGRTQYADRIDEWFEGLQHGVNLAGDDPRLKVRERFMASWSVMSGATHRPLRYALLVKAWNAWAKGEGMSILRWARTEELPQVTGFTWKLVATSETTEEN